MHGRKFGTRLQWICQTFHVRRFLYSIFLPQGWNWKTLAYFQPIRSFSACMLFSIAACGFCHIRLECCRLDVASLACSLLAAYCVTPLIYGVAQIIQRQTGMWHLLPEWIITTPVQRTGKKMIVAYLNVWTVSEKLHRLHRAGINKREHFSVI